VENKQLTLDKLTPGVQCERCHGPSEHHLEGIRKGDTALARMKDLHAFNTEETSNFCGQCHRTWDEVAAMGRLGVLSVRFQPYRLTNSKCYDTEDKRISCTACHDPHQEINRVDASYDSKCLACHNGGKPAARACKVGTSNCAGCHMPKVEIQGSHHQFSDHEIRIVRANAPYPD
jgi:Zn finger protein HypA/HybF involved in hydrogenase expression